MLFRSGNVMLNMKYDGWVDYPDVGRITDKDVHKVVKDHSRLIDRLSSKRMVEMTLFAQNVLMKLFDGLDAKDKSWKFYGKHSGKFRKLMLL